jgi:predicted glycosyltransferase involved in capsule biosynthesis
LWTVEVTGKELGIGHWHNIGARMASSEWIMKLDVDTLPNPRYFKELLPLLAFAKPREWFNGGMIYLNPKASSLLATKDLTERSYMEITENPGFYSSASYLRPAGTNFICRRQEYLDLGGCDERFRGYGWEDYQQIYMLERHQRGANPLPGRVDLKNVTWRCRDEISRAKAWELFQKNRWLCLLHRWHPRGPYRSAMADNRTVLLDHIHKNS